MGKPCANTPLGFYAQHLKNKTCKLVFHIDEARLGNVLRPDAGRSFHQIVWTIAELPFWHRNRQEGWIPFTYVRGKDVTASQMSAVFAQLIREFFPETIVNATRPVFSMKLGIELTDGVEKYIFRAELDALVQHFQPRRGDV